MWSWLLGRKSVGEEETRASLLAEALPLITVEFERARRYERTVTIAVFTPPSGDRSPGRPRAATFPSVLATIVAGATRGADLVACDPAGRRCIVVMPEIGPEEGRLALDRMRRLCADRLDCDIQAQIVVFPQDGWTFEQLLEEAQRRTQGVVIPAAASVNRFA